MGLINSIKIQTLPVRFRTAPICLRSFQRFENLKICAQETNFFLQNLHYGVSNYFFLKFFQIWNAVSLQTLHILGRGEARRAFSAISFSKVTRGGNEKYSCSVFRATPFPMRESCLRKSTKWTTFRHFLAKAFSFQF